MKVTFDASDLHLENAGVFTYGSQLLRSIALESPDTELVLYDASGRAAYQAVRSSLDPTLASLPYRRTPAQWTLACGPEGRFSRLRDTTITRTIDRFTVGGAWSLLAGRSASARVLLPSDVRSTDVVHWSILRCMPTSAASVYTLHDAIPLLLPSAVHSTLRDEFERQMKRVRRFVTRVIADSESTRRDAIRLGLFDEDRIDVVPLAVSEDFGSTVDRGSQEAILRRYHLTRGNYVLYLGRVEPHKNLVRLARAFRAAVECHPEYDTQLVIAGKIGAMTEPIRKELEEVGLGSRLVLTGRVDQAEVGPFLNGARAVALVSLYEGFGLPALEAMACGSAVVASNNSSLPEVVGDAGLLVDPTDTSAIAHALERVITDDNLAASLAERGRRRAGLFTWSRTARQTLGAYRRAIEDTRQPWNV